MTELVYHDPSDRTGVSPFDEAIRRITKDEEALIACPYISLDYLKEVTKQTDDWFLLTDVEEWLSAYGTRNREAIQEFLIEQREQVRHVTDLHAKVVVGGDRALLGSANFTKKGLTGRTEMSVLLSEESTINELTEWFETLWAIYDPPEIDRLEAYIESTSEIPSPAQNRSGVSLSSGESPGRATLSESAHDDADVSAEHEESHTELVRRASNAPSPEWIRSYFKLIGELLSETGLSVDDPQLVTSLPQAGTIPVSINNRYVLVAFRDKRSRVEFILSSDIGESHTYLEQADYTGRFDPIYNEDEFDTPWFIGFDGIPNQMVDDEFRDVWMSAVDDEIQRAEASPYKRYHKPVVCNAARNREYREEVIQEAFEMSDWSKYL